MKRLALILILSLGLLACTSEPAAPPPPDRAVVYFEGPAPPQLVTEQYLRRQLDIRVATLWALPLAEAMAGPAHAATRIVGVTAQTWDKDRTVRLTAVMNDGPGQQRHIPMTFVFGGPNYDTTSGSVTTGTCHKLAGAGVATTGEFTTIENHTDSIDVHKISKTVTESTSSSTTLSESIELKSGLTVEGGTPIGGKVAASLETTFGVGKESTEEHSKETSVTVEDEIEVPGQSTYVTIFTTDDSAVDCAVSINAEADWSDIKVTISFPVELRAAYHKRDDRWSRLCYNRPTPYANLCILLKGDGLDDGKGQAQIGFGQGDDVYRFFRGYDVRCPDCGGLDLKAGARANMAKMSDPTSRWISFEGVRHSTTKSDASYKLYDVTGQDSGCLADKLSKSGVPITTIDGDGDGKIDGC